MLNDDLATTGVNGAVDESKKLIRESKEEEHVEQQRRGLRIPSISSLIEKAKQRSRSTNPFDIIPDDKDIDPTVATAAGEPEPVYPPGPFHLASPQDRENAITSFKTLGPDGQAQVIAYFKALIDRVESPNRRVQEMIHFESFPKDVRLELLKYFKQKHKIESNVILAHTLLAYAGELFYLYWDYRARVDIAAVLLPDSLQSANVPFNLAATPFITVANVTFDPEDFVNKYLIKKMVHNRTFIDDVFEHSFLALMFFLYAFGGGYVEVVDIDKDLEDGIGAFKWIPIVILMYAAIAYYTAYNFADTIEGIKEFKDTPSQFNKALNPFNGVNRKERKIAAWTVTHQNLTVIERMGRMAYGGAMAGRQQLGATAGIVMGTAVGIGTMFVATGTRAVAAYKMYNPPFLTPPERLTAAKRDKFVALQKKQKEDFAVAERTFNVKYEQSPKVGELKLFFTPTLFLLAVPGIFAYTIADSFDISEAGEVISGSLIASTVMIGLHALLGLRDPAIRKEIIRLMDAAKPGDPNSLKPNEFAKGLSNLCCLADQGSRSFTMGYSLMQLLPTVFNTSSLMAQRRLASAISFAAFIALSAFRYQQAKVQGSIVTLLPSIFSTESDVKGRVMRFFGRTPASSASHSSSYAYAAPASVELEVNGDRHDEYEDTELPHDRDDVKEQERRPLMGLTSSFK